eukprot:403342978
MINTIEEIQESFKKQQIKEENKRDSVTEFIVSNRKLKFIQPNQSINNSTVQFFETSLDLDKIRKQDLSDLTGYRMRRLIGSGGFGDVYEADMIMRVAMKIIKKDVTYYDIQEIDIMRKVQNPHINQVLDYFVDKQQQLVIIQPLAKLDLREYLKQSQFISETQLKNIIRQVLSGICALHERGIIHRDIKPENILIFEEQPNSQSEKEQIFKVSDFGAAKIMKNTRDKGKSYIGDERYMAPEQKEDLYDKKVDVFSLGLVIFEIISDDRRIPQLANLIKKRVVISRNRQTNVNNYSEGLVRLAYQMCEIDSNDRVSAKEALKILNSLQSSTQLPQKNQSSRNTDFHLFDQLAQENQIDITENETDRSSVGEFLILHDLIEELNQIPPRSSNESKSNQLISDKLEQNQTQNDSQISFQKSQTNSRNNSRLRNSRNSKKLKHHTAETILKNKHQWKNQLNQISQKEDKEQNGTISNDNRDEPHIKSYEELKQNKNQLALVKQQHKELTIPVSQLGHYRLQSTKNQIVDQSDYLKDQQSKIYELHKELKACSLDTIKIDVNLNLQLKQYFKNFLRHNASQMNIKTKLLHSLEEISQIWMVQVRILLLFQDIMLPSGSQRILQNPKNFDMKQQQEGFIDMIKNHESSQLFISYAMLKSMEKIDITFDDWGMGYYESQVKNNDKKIKHGLSTYYTQYGTIENHLYVDSQLKFRRIFHLDGNLFIVFQNEQAQETIESCSFKINFPDLLVNSYMQKNKIDLLKFASKIKLNYYQGEHIKDGSALIRNGKGVLVRSQGTFYEGQFKQNKMHGEGVFYDCQTHQKYSGEFKNGLKHGQGLIKYKNGDILKGSWNDGMANGVFSYTHNDGRKMIRIYNHNKIVSEEVEINDKFQNI